MFGRRLWRVLAFNQRYMQADNINGLQQHRQRGVGKVCIVGCTRRITHQYIDPKRQQIYQSARRKFQRRYMERSAAGSHRWVITNFPCPAFAQEADMSLAEYENFVYAATFADQSDPVAKWVEMRTLQQRMVDWLKGKDQVVVRGPHVDLTLSIAGRTFINSDGKRNMPSGEIFTGPVEDSVEGHVRFSFPVVTQGREIHDIRLRFEAGMVVDASAARNEQFLVDTLDTDPGARRLGEFAFGTNFDIRRFSKNILFDEKIGGTVHMAVGAGYPETGSVNESAVHWDMICDLRDGGEIDVDGQPFMRGGRFVV